MHELSPRQSSAPSDLSLILILLIYLAGVAGWMIADRAPPPWDQSWYLETSERLYLNLADGEVRGFLDGFTQAFDGRKAPLMTLLPFPFYLLFGRGERTVILTMAAVVGLFGWLTFRVANSLGGSRRRAFLGLLIVLTMPLVVGLSRQFLVELPLAALVAGWILGLIRSKGFTSFRHTLGLGVMTGLGLLLKISFPLYVAAPALLVAFREYRTQGSSLSRLIRNVSVLLIGIPIAAVWYWPNFRKITSFVLSAGFGELSRDYSYGSPLALSTINRYLVVLSNLAISTYFVLIFICALLFAAIRATKKSSLGGDLGLVIVWFLPPFLVVLFAANKDYRYLLPALPALAIWLAMMIDYVLGRWSIALLVYPLALTAYVSVPASQTLDVTVGGRWVLWSDELGYAERPRMKAWPHELVIQAVEVESARRTLDSSTPVLVLVADHPFFNQNNFAYLAVHARANLKVTALLTRADADLDQAVSALKGADYVITKSGHQGPGFTTFLNERIGDLLAAGVLPYSPMRTFQLPDRSSATLYKRTESAEGGG